MDMPQINLEQTGKVIQGSALMGIPGSKRRSAVILMVGMVLALAASVHQVTAQNLTPGKVNQVGFSGAPDAAYKLYLPEEYDRKKKWPVLFYYHGQGGSANVGIRKAAGDNAYIIVGMTYHDKDKYGGKYPEEIASFKKVLKDLRSRVNMDPDRVFVSGTSKGGWHVDLFLRRIGPPLIDGAVIIAAGLQDHREASAGEGVAGMPIYIGTGETDVNRVPGYRAKGYYSKRNAIVTHEIYEGMGHGSDMNATRLQAWFDLQAGLKRDRAGINRWFREELQLLKQKETPVENARTYLAIKQDPRFRYLPPEAQRKWRSVTKQLMGENAIRVAARAIQMMKKAGRLRAEAEYVGSEAKTTKNRRKAARIYKQIAKQLKQTELGAVAREELKTVEEQMK